MQEYHLFAFVSLSETSGKKYQIILFWFRPDMSSEIRYYSVPAGFQKLEFGTSLNAINFVEVNKI